MSTDNTWVNLKTPALEVREIAHWWGVPARLVTPHLQEIEGAVQIGRRWRVPLAEMPIEYLQRTGRIEINSVKQGETLPNEKPSNTGELR